MKTTLAVVLALGLSATTAVALDMNDLAPCRAAAARFCDRAGGMTWTNLLQCGATLASHSSHIGDSCRTVLKRYGQL